jgi:hypothetical protein
MDQYMPFQIVKGPNQTKKKRTPNYSVNYGSYPE